MNCGVAINNEDFIKDVYNRMDSKFGEYIFLPKEGLSRVANTDGFPQLSQIAYDELGNEQGHLIAIPLNQEGYLKVLSPKSTEVDMIQQDIFNPEKDLKLYVYIYAIFSKGPEYTVKLMQQLVNTMSTLPNGFTADSCLFMEAISTCGNKTSERLGLSLAYSYQLQGETLNIFQADFQKFLDQFQ